jgi:hypothetical protein
VVDAIVRRNTGSKIQSACVPGLPFSMRGILQAFVTIMRSDALFTAAFAGTARVSRKLRIDRRQR